MTNDQMIAELDNAKQSITLVQEALGSTPVDEVIHVRAGQSIQAAVDSAPLGATIAIEAATYDEPLYLHTAVMLVPEQALRHQRASRDPGVWITSAAEGTLTITGSGIAVAGLGITNREPSYDAIDITGSRVLIDRCTVIGDPQHGMRRGFLTHGSNIKILGCYADDIFNVSRDTCCVGGWTSGNDVAARLRDILHRSPAPENIVIDSCYLCGGAEGVMYGGADTTSPAKIPHHITLSNSTVTKKPEWYARGDIQLKNGLELKCAEHVYVADCLIEGGGVWEGQAGYICLLTVRNQDGTAPWSCITDVVIERTHFRYGGGGISFLGHDDQYASGVLKDVIIRNCCFSEIDPLGFTATSWANGSGWVSFFNNTPQNVRLEGITASGTNLWALGTFANVPNQPTGLQLVNWKFPPTTYGWSVDGGGKDVPPEAANIRALMPDLVYEVTATDPGAQGYPQP